MQWLKNLNSQNASHEGDAGDGTDTLWNPNA